MAAPAAPKAPTPPPPAPTGSKKDDEKGIILVSYPKIVFLWPAWVVSIVAGLMMHFGGLTEGSTTGLILSWTFLIVLGINLIVLSFDFPRSTSLLLVAVIIALVLGGTLLVVKNPELFPNARDLILKMHPHANGTFLLLFASAMGVIYFTVLVTSRLDYWEVRPNELLHHHGMLSDLERFSSPNLRIDKEINDVFEFILAGSGRLILHPSNQPRAIVLDNVFFINRKEQAITKLLGALQVQVRESKG